MKPIEAFPLSWPIGTARTPAGERQRARFCVESRSGKQDVTIYVGICRIRDAVEHLDAANLVISTNVPMRMDGLPYSKSREPDDPWVAVYFVAKGRPRCMSCDRWDRGLFAIAAGRGEEVEAVVILGRPVARVLDDGWTVEVTRRCAKPDARNACSMLYAAAWRAARAMGYRKLVTYTLASESGVSLRAAGLRCVGQVRAKSWHTPARPRVDKNPLQTKLRWEVRAEIAPASGEVRP